MKRTAILAFLLAFAATALGGTTLEELAQDSQKKKAIDKGLKFLDEYFRAEAEVKKPKQRKVAQWEQKQLEAKREFLAWLGGTRDELGVDLRALPQEVVKMFDQARVKYLESRYKRGRVDYVKIDDPRGMDRHEYTLLIGKNYNPSGPALPVVISLHGRVINDRHPAFRGSGANFSERSRVTVHNNWSNNPLQDDLIVIAPTSSPDGFTFDDDLNFRHTQVLYRTLIEVLTNYRTDWDRIFLEVQGQALRVCCEQAMMFAGFILRDRVDDRRKPPIDPTEWFMLENLNGVPLIYIADSANWDSVGKPMSEALQAAYKKAGVPENFTVLQAERNVDGALQGHEETIKTFVQKHSRPKVRKRLVWRFHKKEMSSPVPVELVSMNFNYGEEAKEVPLADKAGRLTFEVTLDRYKEKNEAGEEVEKPYNRLLINVTEAEKLRVWLYDELIAFDLPVTVVVNGKEERTLVKVERDWDVFFDSFLPGRFFMIPALQALDLSFESVPQHVPPKPAEGAAEKPPAEAGEGAEGAGAGEAEKEAAHGK